MPLSALQLPNLILSFLLFANIASAQISVYKEPHHKVVLDNPYVRLLEGHIPSGDTTVAHQHAANSVVIFLSSSIFGIQTGEGKPVITEVKPGDIRFAAYGDSPIVHKVWGQGKGMFHFMVAELSSLRMDSTGCPIISGPNLRFQWRKKSVMAYALDIVKGQRYHLPKSDCAVLLIDIAGKVTEISSGSQRPLSEGSFAFFLPQKDIEINSGKENAHFVLLELK